MQKMLALVFYLFHLHRCSCRIFLKTRYLRRQILLINKLNENRKVK